MDVEHVVNGALFDADGASNMVMVRDIELYSLCEHHLLPFYGRAHIAYIPKGKIVGLSKLPRLVEVFARRLQVQERLTEQIASAVEEVLKPQGVGVVIEAYHLCMMMRGVEKQNSKTITSALRGLFRSDPRTREEFLTLAYARQAGGSRAERQKWPGAAVQTRRSLVPSFSSKRVAPDLHPDAEQNDNPGTEPRTLRCSRP
jgi:GTP cyclohydrolase I